jgi:hypothetical protein
MKTAKIIIISGCTLGAVLFMGAGFMLYRGITGFNQSRNNLDKLKISLEQHYKSKIFPSRENVKIELENADQADEWFNNLISTLSKGNIVSTERSPSIFITTGNTVRRNLRKKARKAGTVMPDSKSAFAFGFERYTRNDGTLPKSEEVPRLIEQLVIINRICAILFENNIKEISSVKRDEFESIGNIVPGVDVDNSGSRRRSGRSRNSRSARTHSRPTAVHRASDNVSMVGIIGEDSLYAKMHFVFEFRAKEKALLDILNALSTGKMFVVVTSVSLSKSTPDLVPKIVDPAEAEPDAGIGFGGSHTKKEDKPVEPPKLGPNYPVCGIKMEIPMDIHLELDVYKFKEADSDSGN